MKGIIALLHKLENQGVKLTLNDEEQLISQSHRDAVTPEIGASIKENKEAIIQCLKARSAFEKEIPVLDLHTGPLSSSQSGLWFIEQYEDNSHLYNMPVYFRLTGTLDVLALEFAFSALIKKHASLRTRFCIDKEGKGQQIIDPDMSFAVEHKDLLDVDESQRESLLQKWVLAEVTRPFDLTTGPLTRISLIKMSSHLHVLMITQHHIISDGWSVKNMFADFKQAFIACQKGLPDPLTPTRRNYIDYAHWFNSNAFLNYHQQFKDFWTDRLSGIPEVHSLALDKPRPANQDTNGEVIFSSISNEQWDKFKTLCQRHNTSSFIGLHAIFSLLIARISGEADVVIGSPLAYRERHDIDDVVGFFVNTIVLRTQLPSQQSFVDYLTYCREQDLSAFDHQLFRFEALSEAISSDRTTAINPIFQIMLVYQAKVDFNDLIPGCGAVEETSPLLPAKTDLSMKVTELVEEVRLDWLFATALFERETIQMYADSFIRLLGAVVDTPDADIWSFAYGNPSITHRVVKEYQQIQKSYLQQPLCHTRISELAQIQPLSIAVEDGIQQSLTYAELEKQSNQLAHWLSAVGVTNGDLVGIIAKRNRYFVISLLAIWKVGAAYVPLDPVYPTQRLNTIVKDAKLSIILTEDRSQVVNKIDNALLYDLSDPDFAKQLTSFSSSIPTEKDIAWGEVAADDLAYVIYTSGSTGQPKGVMVEHGSLLNLVEDHIERTDIQKDSRMFNCFSLSFDAGNMTTLVPVCAGATLVFGDPGESVLADLRAYKITHTILPTALLAALKAEPLPSLSCIGFGGEACPQSIFDEWSSTARLINFYGPTECTVTALAMELQAGQAITIGQPIRNIQALILDNQGNLCPDGVVGELCLLGLGVARGYLNKPELTREAFIDWQHPIGERVRIYKTGDKARRRHDGNYEYRGRIDEQVKLRGYRIELGEIEAILRAVCPALQQIKVIITGKRLLAYATLGASNIKPRTEDVLQELAKQIPEYMVPSALYILAEMPLTPNGKIDTKNLPVYDLALAGQASATSSRESQVLAIWQAVLNVKCGVEDDFFRLGGDSILSIQLATRLKDEGFNCSVKDVFEAKTVRRLCRLIEQNNTHISINAEQGILEGHFELHPIQRWFLEQPFSKPEHWNQAALIALPQDIDTEKLQRCMSALLNQHDALRLSFKKHQQYYQGHVELPLLTKLDASAFTQEQLYGELSQLQASLDLEKGPMMAWALIHHHPESECVLFLAFHHLVIDAVSWRILTEDLSGLYQGRKLSQKTSSYRQWGEGLKHFAERHTDQYEYWAAQRQNVDLALAKTNPESTASHSVMTLDEAHTRQITEANRAFNTETNELLLAALVRSLAEVVYEEQPVVMLEGHGREMIDPTLDVSRTVGWFTSTYPVKLQDKDDLGELLVQCKEKLRNVPDKGVGFNALRTYHPKGDQLSASTIIFNYLGQSGQVKGEWRPLEGVLGDSVSPENKPEEIISIHGGIFGGCLTLRQVGKLIQTTSDQLMLRFKDNLLAILEFCQSQYQINGTVYTPADYPGRGLKQRDIDYIYSHFDVETILPASSLQESMLYHHMRVPQDDAYLLVTPIHYSSDLDIDVYKRAWQAQIDAFPALRSSLYLSDEVVQVIHRQMEVPFYYQDFSQSEDPDKQIEACKQEMLTNSFDLMQPGLIQIHCFKVNHQDYRVLLSCHHCLLDGWSGPRIMAGVHDAYEQQMAGKPLLRHDDTAYIEQAEYRLRQQPKVEEYWQNRDLKPVSNHILNTLFDSDLSAMQYQHSPSVVAHTLTAEQHQQLINFGREVGITSSIVAQYAWHQLLAIHSQLDVTQVGNVLTGRDSPVAGISESVGLYINTLPLQVFWDKPQSRRQHMLAMQSQLMDINQYVTQSLVKLGAECGGRLFDSLFVYENYPMPSPPKGARLLQPQFGAAYEKVEVPLSLVVREKDSRLYLRFEFDAACITPQKAEHVLQRWVDELLSIISQSPDTEVVSRPANSSCAKEPEITPSSLNYAKVTKNTPWSSAVRNEQGDRVLTICQQHFPAIDNRWDQSLFTCGIDSIQQIVLVTQLSREFGCQVSVEDLQQYSSPQALQYLLEKRQQGLC